MWRGAGGALWGWGRGWGGLLGTSRGRAHRLVLEGGGQVLDARPGPARLLSALDHGHVAVIVREGIAGVGLGHVGLLLAARGSLRGGGGVLGSVVSGCGLRAAGSGSAGGCHSATRSPPVPCVGSCGQQKVARDGDGTRRDAAYPLRLLGGLGVHLQLGLLRVADRVSAQQTPRRACCNRYRAAR
jgi:hypothetical protein